LFCFKYSINKIKFQNDDLNNSIKSTTMTTKNNIHSESIQVFIRIRPKLQNELKQNNKIFLKKLKEQEEEIKILKMMLNSFTKKNTKSFT